MIIYFTALNAAELPDHLREVALNFELAVGDDLPAELPLIPPGEVVQGRDGRYWHNRLPQGVVDYFVGRAIDVPIDIEHATELKAPKGEAAPAMGWIKALSVREGGAVWGSIEWTPRGAELITNREYRYYSTVLIYEKDSLTIRGIASVGLTNKPNLNVLALNQENKEHTMDLKALLVKLGLPETATIEQALNAIGTLQGNLQTALNRAETPSLDKFVPRADYDSALARATNAEQKLQDKETAELETAINREVDDALKAGKITPATKDFYAAMCRQEGGLDQFRKFVEAAPVVGGPSGLDNKSPETGAKALNAEAKQLADMFGNSAEDLAKYGQA
ncbi:phage protease [Syntrophotalea acetylenica]|uniref:phage protease n=1 Tax=Syntrophotalea acetylenica TaxID=29542 RepID=UPI002A370AA9|nr:phage protease [Syntrophotalea acetylenica]MDY0261985.1 phage protease [Syntrophotalea acetylenica]